MLPSIPYVDPPGMALQIQFLPAGPLEKAGSSPRSYRILFSLGSVGYGSGACISALFISSWLCLVELKNCGPFISRHIHGRIRVRKSLLKKYDLVSFTRSAN